ncbi:MAG: hypothetical protein MJZ65_05845 [Paludibacteraceae bacterium]|nr:hypothetical protein [Paludibacteraceae bacterium]
MKKIKYFLFLSACIAFVSCNTTYTYSYSQIAQTTGVEKNGLTYNKVNGCYEYTDDVCTIAYNMRNISGGQICYTITNNTNRILYIDNKRSFLVKDGKSYIASSVTPEENYIELGAVAPHATASIVGPALNCPLYLDCDLNRTPDKNKPASMTFDFESTPLLFRSVLCYRLSGSDDIVLVDNAFYISRITNYRTSDLSEMVTEDKENCLNVEGYSHSTKQQYRLNLFRPSNSIWITNYFK